MRGLYKRYLGGSRQDDLCVRVHERSRTLIVAVADGVSGAPRSDLGAALAVRQAASAVHRQLDGDAAELDWQDVFAQAAWALVEEHRRDVADPEAGVDRAAQSLATTLLVAAVSVERGGGTEDGMDEDGAEKEDGMDEDAAEKEGGTDEDRAEPSRRADDGAEQAVRTDNDDAQRAEDSVRVQLAAVGDSPALLLEGGTFTTVIGSSDDLLGGGVEALPRTSREAFSESCTLEPGSVLLLCTDGLALPLAGGVGEVGRTLARELARPPDIADFARLLDFSRNTYDDDRTLVAIWREQ